MSSYFKIFNSKSIIILAIFIIIFIVYKYYNYLEYKFFGYYEEIPIIKGAKILEFKNWNIYYTRFARYNTLDYEIENFKNIMKGWKEKDWTGCNNKKAFFFKYQDNRLIPYISYNASWQKNNKIALAHFERINIYNKNYPINIFFLITEISEDTQSIKESNKFKSNEVWFNAQLCFINLSILLCYKNSQLETLYRNFINLNYNLNEYIDLNCKKMNLKNINYIKISFNEKKESHNLEMNMDEIIYKNIFKKFNSDDFLFLINKNHVILFSKIKDIIFIDDKLIINAPKDIIFILYSHFALDYACCH